MKCKITTERWWWNYKRGQPRGYLCNVCRWSVARNSQHHHSNGHPQKCYTAKHWKPALGEIHSCRPHKKYNSSNFPSTAHFCYPFSSFLPLCLLRIAISLAFYLWIMPCWCIPFFRICSFCFCFSCMCRCVFLNAILMGTMYQNKKGASFISFPSFTRFFSRAYLCMSLLARKPPAWWIW